MDVSIKSISRELFSSNTRAKGKISTQILGDIINTPLSDKNKEKNVDNNNKSKSKNNDDSDNDKNKSSSHKSIPFSSTTSYNPLSKNNDQNSNQTNNEISNSFDINPNTSEIKRESNNSSTPQTLKTPVLPTVPLVTIIPSAQQYKPIQQQQPVEQQPTQPQTQTRILQQPVQYQPIQQQQPIEEQQIQYQPIQYQTQPKSPQSYSIPLSNPTISYVAVPSTQSNGLLTNTIDSISPLQQQQQQQQPIKHQISYIEQPILSQIQQQSQPQQSIPQHLFESNIQSYKPSLHTVPVVSSLNNTTSSLFDNSTTFPLNQSSIRDSISISMEEKKNQEIENLKNKLINQEIYYDDKLSQISNSYQNQISDLQNTINSFENDKNLSNQTLERLEKMIKDKNNEISQLESSKNSRIEALENTLNLLQQDRNDTNTSFTQSIIEKDNKIGELKATYSIQIKELENCLSTITLERDNQNASIMQLQGLLNRQNSELNELRNEKLESSKILNEYKQQINNLKNQFQNNESSIYNYKFLYYLISTRRKLS